MMPEISIIMLTHNREDFLPKAISSILDQTFTDYEFIIVDNGSRDKSGKIADAYAEKDKRIRVVHTEEKTIGAGRNTGLDLARGRYIAFIDDDDYAYPEMMSFLYKMITEENADISVCGSVRDYDGDVRPYYVYDEKYILSAEEATKEYLKRELWNAPMPTKMFRKELFEKIRFLEDTPYDDIRIAYKLFAEAERTIACGKVMYCFMNHSGNNSLAARSEDMLYPELLEEYFHAFQERTLYITKKFPKIADYARYSEWSYMLSMCHKISKNHLENCRVQLEYIKCVLIQNYTEIFYSPYITLQEREYMKKYIA